VRLTARLTGQGYRLEAFDSLGSTNDEAMARAREGDPGRLWITAARQTGGKGRLGRTWVSPVGNLHASLLLVDAAPPERAPELGFVTGVALASALRRHLGPQLRLKWPNDAVVDGAKLAGVLLEAAQTPHGGLACVIGVGVNCASHPEGLPYPATDLASLGHPLTPDDLLESLSLELADWLDRWDEGRGFAQVRAAWLSCAAGMGEPAVVAIGDRRLHGVLEGLDGFGRLLLKTEAGQRAIDAGDVFLTGLIEASGQQQEQE
jgi:BirA family biotin operon repressor/biotin-[acetyl-CoA-carboxylase] ligase